MSGLFSVDAETNGLHGEVWAVGACYMTRDADGDARSEIFGCRTSLDNVSDPWVIENVVPHCIGLAEVTEREMLESFWQFWMKHNENRTVTAIANFGVPVEALLFRRCIERDVEKRNFLGPFPLHELATAYLANGIMPGTIDTFEFCEIPDLRPHNPIDDAIAAAGAWRKLFKL